MKKTFLARRNALFSSADASWGVYALIAAFVLLAVRLVAPDLFWRAVAPVFRVADATAAQSHLFFSGFRNTAQLALHNERLLRENAALSALNQELLQKDLSLEALLGAPGGASGTGLNILAGVVARPPESPYDILILAKGSDTGVGIGQEVYGEGGVPVGIVSSVTAGFSRVTLFSSPGTSIHGWAGRATVPIVINGSGGGSMSATLARATGVAVGDTVFVPGPGMLPIGTVVRIDSDPLSPSVTLRIRPLINMFSITWVVLRETGTALIGAFSQASSTLP